MTNILNVPLESVHYGKDTASSLDLVCIALDFYGIFLMEFGKWRTNEDKIAIALLKVNNVKFIYIKW